MKADARTIVLRNVTFSSLDVTFNSKCSRLFYHPSRGLSRPLAHAEHLTLNARREYEPCYTDATPLTWRLLSLEKSESDSLLIPLLRPGNSRPRNVFERREHVPRIKILAVSDTEGEVTVQTSRRTFTLVIEVARPNVRAYKSDARRASSLEH